jgi:hypothetical protein
MNMDVKHLTRIFGIGDQPTFLNHPKKYKAILTT